MNNLIKIDYNNSDRPTVMGRELHKALEVKTKYTDWFKRMCEYGFTENSDFVTVLKNEYRADGTLMPQKFTDHQITITMAKELCMIQRTPIGKEIRQYFIVIEEKWNSPEAIMARALQIANDNITNLKLTCNKLNETISQQLIQIEEQTTQIEEMKPKVTYYDLILQSPELIPISVIAKDYGKTAQWLNKYLNEHHIQYKQGGIWLLYKNYSDKGYTSTFTHSYNDNKGATHSSMQTYWTQKGRKFIYELLKENNILPLIEQDNTEKESTKIYNKNMSKVWF